MKEVTLDIGHEIPAYSEICTSCAYRPTGIERTCKAFPDGIPIDIWMGNNDHKQPYQGDNGIMFAPRTKTTK
ncbi:MAG: hypothetical protein FDX02_08485 [Chlorobium sp.]|nr:MAG: hypothetical protein FDX02_08485 [Chlorobium sp.]